MPAKIWSTSDNLCCAVRIALLGGMLLNSTEMSFLSICGFTFWSFLIQYFYLFSSTTAACKNERLVTDVWSSVPLIAGLTWSSLLTYNSSFRFSFQMQSVISGVQGFMHGHQFSLLWSEIFSFPQVRPK